MLEEQPLGLLQRVHAYSAHGFKEVCEGDGDPIPLLMERRPVWMGGQHVLHKWQRGDVAGVWRLYLISKLIFDSHLGPGEDELGVLA